DSVGSDQIADGAIQSNHLAGGSVGTSAIAIDSVPTNRIQDAAVTAAKLDKQYMEIDEVDYLTSSRVGVQVKEIPPWDMQTDPNLDVAHGLTGLEADRIIFAWASIRNDTDSILRYPLSGDNGMVWYDDTNIGLIREASGFFDHANFSNTGWSRGSIFIVYLKL